MGNAPAIVISIWKNNPLIRVKDGGQPLIQQGESFRILTTKHSHFFYSRLCQFIQHSFVHRVSYLTVYISIVRINSYSKASKYLFQKLPYRNLYLFIQYSFVRNIIIPKAYGEKAFRIAPYNILYAERKCFQVCGSFNTS